MTIDVTAGHIQQITNHYQVVYPAHAPRVGDPHYAAFNAYHRAHEKTSICYVGDRVGFDQCADAQGNSMLDQPGHPGLELHHKILEFSLINEVDLKALEVDFPDLTDPEKVASWAETDANFLWVCAKHHRGEGGVHHAAYADFEASMYIRNLISPSPKGVKAVSETPTTTTKTTVTEAPPEPTTETETVTTTETPAEPEEDEGGGEG